MGHHKYTGPYPANVELPDGEMTTIFVEPGEVVTVDDTLDEHMDDTKWEPSDTPPKSDGEATAEQPPTADTSSSGGTPPSSDTPSPDGEVPPQEPEPTDAHPSFNPEVK